ncbi:MAG: CDP-glycerol glycerophosphotransferase family protein [Lachnospiraceae bacterium]|nr:CDP-glycerol glycerophosphotransferase family protein [Lachnospiraceae bacterium]
MKVSVIIAAYNAEKYVAETLDSVLGQTLDDYEVIVVNDGSSDGTKEILDEYGSRSDRMTVIHKENGGPSQARNTGLDIAKGEFVFFFDADDILDVNALEWMYDRAQEQKADLVIARYDVFNELRTIPITNINGLTAKDEIERFDPQILWTFSLCNKLFRRSVIEEHGLRLPPISYSEDGVFVMRYVYACARITGLPQVIFHYRRLFNGDSSSITATVSLKKIQDYTTAHNMILEAAEEAVLRENRGKYTDLAQAKREDIQIREYIDEIIRKELTVLVDQFYVKFWKLDEETVRVIREELDEKLARMDVYNAVLLRDSSLYADIESLEITKEEALAHAYFTVAFYGDAQDLALREEELIKALTALTMQNLVRTELILPETLREFVREQELLQDNMVFIPVDGQDAFYRQALRQSRAPYIGFSNCRFVYANNYLRFIYKKFLKSQADGLSQVTYYIDHERIQPLYPQVLAINSLKCGYMANELLQLDHILENKFFRREFLMKHQEVWQEDMNAVIDLLRDRGYYTFQNDRIVFFNGNEETFLEYLGPERTALYRKKLEQTGEFALDRKMSRQERSAALLKLEKISERKPKKFKDRVLRKVGLEFMKLPVKEQVLFMSIRKDRELEGNAKALYPHVRGKKKVIAKQLPHNMFQEMRMIYEILRSKVIVTDDYLRDLRYFPLRPEQKVIQLWHACGAFKQFGQYGTNMAVSTDKATHAQYDLVCVSGQKIRSVYADAFDVPLERVQDLGCPRTDLLFDPAYKEEAVRRIYEKHPELKGKEIILYAPTFRDMGGDRTVFVPDIDFARLSAAMPPEQVMLICPHPVMKNSIVDGSYDNIRVMRDFSTNDYMLVSDMLITDYSSVIFEYALLGKPIVFYCYDLELYNRGFYLDYPADLPGEVLKSQEELEAFLTSPDRSAISERYHTFMEQYMSACDGHSCERIAGLINRYMEGK